MRTTYSHLPCHGVLLFCALIFFGGLVLDQYAWADESSPPLDHADRSFIEKAAEAGREEVAISQIAVDRTTNAKVKDFAQMMISDHTSADETLARIASAKGVALTEEKAAPSKWSKKNASDFDQDYADKMVSDHESAVTLFTKEANYGKDAETVQFARDILPTLEHHLEKANDLERSLQ